jgi:predicted negative regulator of RcsB-dependent stress response
MAIYDLEEQEQLSVIKAWWQQYANLITGIAVLAAVASVGYQGWNWYQRQQSAKASAIYAVVQRAVADKDAARAKEAAGELLEKFSGSAYAAMGAVLSAKVQFDTGDLKTAHAELAWAAENAHDDELKDLARLRLAAVMVDEEAYGDALKQLEKEPVDAFVARYAELRGDIYVAQHKRNEARAAYQTALAKLNGRARAGVAEAGVTNAMHELIRVKLEALGEVQ